MEYRLQPQGLAVLAFWCCLPGCALSAFFFWQSLWAGLVFLCVWTAAALGLCFVRGGSVRVSCERGELRVRAGVLFRTLKRMPARFVSGVGLVSTPLLGWAGCRILIVHSAGILLALAGLSAADAEALAALLGGTLSSDVREGPRQSLGRTPDEAREGPG